MKTDIAKRIEATSQKAKYDSNVKFLLAEKIILAHIVTGVIPEFKQMNPEDVVSLIEEEPSVESTPVDKGLSNAAIANGSKEDNVPGEGYITYDVLFNVRTPDSTKDCAVFIKIDLEAQTEYYEKYNVVTRGIFYAAREISAQKTTVFSGSNYQNIQQVYSIWIISNGPDSLKGAINEYSVKETQIVGDFTIEKKYYDIPHVVLIGLDDAKVEKNSKNRDLVRLLSIYLSSTLNCQEKESLLETDYGIRMSEEAEGRLEEMCNLSQGIEKQGLIQGIVQSLQGYIKSTGCTIDEAFDLLAVSEENRLLIRPILEQK